MGIRDSGWRTATAAEAGAGFGWFYDKPLPYSLTPQAEAALDDPQAEADI